MSPPTEDLSMRNSSYLLIAAVALAGCTTTSSDAAPSNSGVSATPNSAPKQLTRPYAAQVLTSDSTFRAQGIEATLTLAVYNSSCDSVPLRVPIALSGQFLVLRDTTILDSACSISASEKGQSLPHDYLPAQGDFYRVNDETILAKIFTVELVAITGITEGQGEHAGESIVEYSWKRVPTALARQDSAWFMSDADLAVHTTGRATLKRYDDGWRVTTVSLWPLQKPTPYVMPI